MARFKILAVFLVLSFILASCSIGSLDGLNGTDEINLEQETAISGAAEGIASESIDNGQNVIDVMDKGPVKGGTLKLFTTSPDSFNPIFTRNSYVQDFLGLVYEGLTRLNEKQEAVAMLSDKWSVSQDGLVWNFHIRAGVKWQDGEPFTSKDVEFTVSSILNGKTNSQYKDLLKDVVAYSSPDQENFRVELNKPNSFLPQLMSFPVIAKHQFSTKAASDDGTGFKPVGTGPYSFESYSKDKKIKLTVNRSWWYALASENPEQLQYIKNLEIMVYKTPKEAMNAFQNNDIDIASIDASDMSKYYGRTDIIIRKYTSRNFLFAAFNLSGRVSGDVSVRQAVNLAIDRKSIIHDIFDGCATQSDIPVNPDCWILNETQPGNTVPTGTGEYPTPAVTVGTASAGTLPEGTTPAAVLEAGGWKKGSQYYYNNAGGIWRELKLEILTANTNPQRIKIADKLCAQLNAAGIAASVVQLDWDKFTQRIAAKKYDLAVMGLRTGRSADVSYLYTNNTLIANNSANGDHAWDIAGYNNITVDNYLQKILSGDSNGSISGYFKEMSEVIKADLPYIGLCFPDEAVIYRKNVRGIFQPNTWNKYFDITKWYLPD